MSRTIQITPTKWTNQIKPLRVHFLLAAAAPLLLSGCNVSHDKNDHGDNVQMRTPFGDMHIKTSDDANIAGIGLSPYPGAVPVKEHDGKDKDAADINLNFGDFHLGVKAASFQSSDSTDKVEAFYRNDMARYGEVLTCENNHPVGQPARTTEGLTCDDDHNHHVNIGVDDDHSDLQLRAGSPGHFHIVGIKNKDGGTRIGLVLLDLPIHHDSSDKE
jgi:hypothetical protein